MHKGIKKHNLQLLCETSGHFKEFLQQAIAFQDTAKIFPMITGLLTLPPYPHKAGVTYANHGKAICEG